MTRVAAVGAFRLSVTGFLLGVCAQPVLIGLFLGGDFDRLATHRLVGGVLIPAAALQLASAVLAWRPGRRSAWPIAVCAAILVAVVIQVSTGYARELGLHVPLGVALVTASVGLVGAAWRSPARSGGRASATGAAG